MQNNSVIVRPMNSFDNVNTISELIYNTDPFIYPEAFGDIDNARVIISDMIQKNCGIFCQSNIYVACIEDEIAGIAVLLNETVSSIPAYYSPDNLPESFHVVRDLYFNELHRYIDSKSPFYLACLCVDKEHRNLGIGGSILNYFINDISKHSFITSIKLHVLVDNSSAIHLYLKHGFQITKEDDGFSINTVKPKCYEMRYQ